MIFGNESNNTNNNNSNNNLPPISRRRGTASLAKKRNKNGVMILNLNSLLVLSAILITVFVIGVLIGSHTIITSTSQNKDVMQSMISNSGGNPGTSSRMGKGDVGFFLRGGGGNKNMKFDDDDDAGDDGRANMIGNYYHEKKNMNVDANEIQNVIGSLPENNKITNDKSENNNILSETDLYYQDNLEHKNVGSLPEENKMHNDKSENNNNLEQSDLYYQDNLEHENVGSFPYFGAVELDTPNYQPKGGGRFEEYKDGDAPYVITDGIKYESDSLARIRREYIKGGMKHAWDGYKTHAFGSDEVLPITGGKNNNWGGTGTTLVDSLSTLWLMGLKTEFWEGRDWVRDKLSFNINRNVSLFETTIRSLGGLLSAYDWSGDKSFLDKALDLGERLIKSFDTTSGLPHGQVNLATGDHSNAGWTGRSGILAEIGTLQVEFRYLSKVTGNRKFADKAEAAFSKLKSIEPPNGLYPYFVKIDEAHPSFGNNKLSFGAMADSFYEYMLKIWLQGGKKEMIYREMYDKAMDGMHAELLQKSTPTGLWYIADKNNGHLDHKMDHLVCFMGGLLALGAYTDPNGLSSPRAQRDLKTAKALTYTCYQMYARMPTGISPEYVRFSDNDLKAGSASYYILRPETVESFFILNKLTGDPIYREWGWEVFQSIEKYCRTDIAYGSVHDVKITDASPENRMESFFLAETMKYLYLLMDPDTEIDILEKHVFNTEAHPLRTYTELETIM